MLKTRHSTALGVESQCLVCHDGTVGEDVHGGVTAPGVGSAGSSHPVGVPYLSRPRGFSDNSLLPVASLDERLVLPEGRVECVTCHDPFSTAEDLLVMSNHGSSLCLSCHSF